MIKYKIRGSDWLTFPLTIVNRPLTVDRPRDGNYKMCKFMNTYTQDNRQVFQIIGQIHGKMLLHIDLFTLSCG